MKSNQTPRSSYTWARKAIHWAVLLLCVAQFPTGWAIANSHLGHVSLTQTAWSVFVHRSHALIGTGVVVLAVAGVSLRLFQGAILPPDFIAPAWMRYAATATHLMLYAILLALSLTGFVAMYLSRVAAPVHVALTYLGLAVVAIHVAGALWHQFVFGDGTITRILPRVSFWSR